MLRLQRYKGQSILIGDNIKIYFLENKDGGVTVGIEAPRELKIVRGEIADKPPKRKDGTDGNIA